MYSICQQLCLVSPRCPHPTKILTLDAPRSTSWRSIDLSHQLWHPGRETLEMRSVLCSFVSPCFDRLLSYFSLTSSAFRSNNPLYGFSTNLTKAADLRSSLPAQRVTACLPFSHSRSFGQYPLEDSQQSRSRSNVPSEAWRKQLGDSETQLPKNLNLPHLASSIQVFWICGGLWISRIVLASFQAQGQTSKDMIVEFKRRNSQIWRFETDSCKSRSEEHSGSCTTLNAWRPELSFFIFNWKM